MSRERNARTADLRSNMCAWRQGRSGLTLGKLLAAGRRSAEIERLETRVLLSAWTVNTLNDLIANDGALSLREAISMSASNDTVNFAPSLAGGTIMLNGTELSIVGKTLTIQGLGVDQLTVSGNTDSTKYSRVFSISDSTVSVQGLTITQGHNTGPGVAHKGGAIYSVSSALNLTSTAFTDNVVAFGSGGAIYAASSTLNLTNSTFRGNTANSSLGGAIYATLSTLTIADSVFTANSAHYGDGGAICGSNSDLTIGGSIFSDNLAGDGSGGAIYSSGGPVAIDGSILSGNAAVDGSGGAIRSSSGTLTLTNSTLIANRSSMSGSGHGGAISGGSGTMTIVGCTFSGNQVSSGYGGAISGGSGTLSIANSTLTGNSAKYGGAIYSDLATVTLADSTLSGNAVLLPNGGGGAVYILAGSVASARNSIISGSTNNGVADDVYGTLDPASSHNLIGVGGGLSNGVNGNIVGVTDPKLAPLANNGGPTQTMALLAGSPALDAGDNSLIPAGTSYDQRGTGHARVVHGTVDIGAYENGLPTAITLSNTSVVENRSAGTAVGSFSATDPDPLDSFIYTLVSGTGSTDNGSFSISGSQLRTAASFNYEVKSSYSIRVRCTDQGGLYTEKVFTITVTDIDDTAPTVTAVYVRGSTWTPGYLSFLAANTTGSSSTYGYGIPVGTGAAQLQTLPWRNLNRISLRFSEEVSLAQAQFAIVGSVGSYSVSGFAYSSADHVATWSLSAAIGPDKLYVALPSSGSSAVRDAAGNVLDGEWINPTSYSDSSTNAVPDSSYHIAA